MNAILRLATYVLCFLAAQSSSLACPTDIAMPVEPERNATVRDRLMATAQPRSETVMIVGDSIAALWPADLRDRTFGGPSFDFGLPGDRLGNITWRLQHADLSGSRFQTIVVIAGTNNLRLNKPCEIVEGLAQLSDMLRKIAPRAIVMVVSILPRGKNLRGYTSEIAEINHGLGVKAQSGAFRFVDAQQAISLGCQGREQGCPLYDGGQLHLSREGYAILGDVVRRALP